MGEKVWAGYMSTLDKKTRKASEERRCVCGAGALDKGKATMPIATLLPWHVNTRRRRCVRAARGEELLLHCRCCLLATFTRNAHEARRSARLTGRRAARLTTCALVPRMAQRHM